MGRRSGKYGGRESDFRFRRSNVALPPSPCGETSSYRMKVSHKNLVHGTPVSPPPPTHPFFCCEGFAHMKWQIGAHPRSRQRWQRTS